MIQWYLKRVYAQLLLSGQGKWQFAVKLWVAFTAIVNKTLSLLHGRLAKTAFNIVHHPSEIVVVPNNIYIQWFLAVQILVWF